MEEAVKEWFLGSMHDKVKYDINIMTAPGPLGTLYCALKANLLVSLCTAGTGMQFAINAGVRPVPCRTCLDLSMLQ